MFDIFGYKSEIKMLNEILTKLRVENGELCEKLIKYGEDNVRLAEENADLAKLFDSTPSDCKVGSYCEACEFSKRYFRRDFPLSYDVFFCNKGNSCTNFVPKKEVKNDE